jgi:hypothetical protein
MNSRIFRRTFLDICNGYSLMTYKNAAAFIKHLSHREHLGLDDLEEFYHAEAVRKGLYTEKDRLIFLNKERLWTDKNEHEILQLKSFIARLNDNKKNIALPSVLNRLKQDIEVEENKLKILINKRFEFIGLTAEGYAKKLVNEYYILRSLYKDSSLKEPFFTEEEFADIEDSELDNIVISYNNIIDSCGEKHIKQLSIQDFFLSYFNLCESNFSSFFGKPICEFTYFQVKLINYARYFSHILEGVDIKTLPEKCWEDPDYLVEFIGTTKKGKEMIENTKGQAVSVVGATQEDIKQISGNNKAASSFGNKPMNMQEIMQAVGGAQQK